MSTTTCNFFASSATTVPGAVSSLLGLTAFGALLALRLAADAGCRSRRAAADPCDEMPDATPSLVTGSRSVARKPDLIPGNQPAHEASGPTELTTRCNH